LKLGKRLAVGGIPLMSEGEDKLAAHAVATYSLPGKERLFVWLTCKERGLCAPSLATFSPA
jgi:hypothetical protein